MDKCLIDSASERELLNAALARIETLEGRMLAARDAWLALFATVPEAKHSRLAQLWTDLYADSMATLKVRDPGGELRPHSAACRAQGYETEWRAIQQMLVELGQ